MNNMKKLLINALVLLLLPVCLFAQETGKRLDDIRIRDPFILVDDASGTYYMYASLTESGVKGVKVYKSHDLSWWQGPEPVLIIPSDFWAHEMVWAPEVHKYKGRYYLFVTLTADRKLKQINGRPEIVNRASQVFVSDSPEGPFEPFANKPHTPHDWMSLDATLWVEDGQPFMIFCHEWIQATDGTMEVVKLKKDLSATVGKPKTIFSARQASWVRSLGSVGALYNGQAYEGYVTDGPFLFRTSAGKLMMIWSSFGEEQYAVGLVESLSGKIEGPWKMIPEPLFKANGGHGMIFRTFEGKLMMVLHQPNQSPLERAKLFELEDIGGSLIMKN